MTASLVLSLICHLCGSTSACVLCGDPGLHDNNLHSEGRDGGTSMCIYFYSLLKCSTKRRKGNFKNESTRLRSTGEETASTFWKLERQKDRWK